MNGDETLQENVEYGLSETQMKNIYMDLSVTDSDDYEYNAEISALYLIIESTFDKNFLLIDTEVLQQNQMLINNKFLEIVKIYRDKNRKIYGIVFIGFCEYFDLNISKTYSLLHEKLQIIIEKHLEKMVGVERLEKMRREKNTHNGVYVPSLFTLFGIK